MSQCRPRVTIALPVYNGEDYLAEALHDLMAQDYDDFELIVSDNASTDGTPQIIAAYAADRRVRVVRHAQNIGASRNFESVIPFAIRDYFLFAAHDDRWAPNYLSRLVATLDAHPNAVMACADSAVIDELSNRTGKIYPSADTSGLDLEGRVRVLVSQFAWVEFYGLMRSEALRAIGSFKPYVGGDVIFHMDMAILGEIKTVHEPLFLYRMPSDRVTDNAYYASKTPMTKQDPRTYTSLVRYMYESLLAARIPEPSLARIRQTMAQAIGVPGGEWFAAIAAECGIPAAGVTREQAQSFVLSILQAARV